MPFSYKYMHLKADFMSETANLTFKTYKTILNFFE